MFDNIFFAKPFSGFSPAGMQLRGGMDKRGEKIQVKHIVEILAENKIRNIPG